MLRERRLKKYHGNERLNSYPMVRRLSDSD